MVRNNQDNNFNKYNLTNINSITLYTQAVNENQVITKAYVDQFHQENELSRQDLGINFFDELSDLLKKTQDNKFNDNKLTNIGSITVNRSPTSNNQVTNKKYVDDSIKNGHVLRFYRTLENYLKVSVGKDTYNLTKDNKIQLTDTTTIKYPISSGFLLPSWRFFCNDKNNIGKIQNFIRSSQTNSPTGNSGATSLPTIGNSFMYIER